MSWLKYLYTYPLSWLCILLGSIIGLLKNHRRAANFFNLALKLTPEWGLAHWGKAATCRLLQDYSQGVYYYNQAVAHNVLDSRLYYYRAACYANLKQYTYALMDYNTALWLQCSMTYHIYLDRGRTYLDMRQYQAALNDFAWALQIKPNKADAYLSQSAALVKVKDYHQAVYYCNLALERNPKLALAYNNRGVAYQRLNNFPQAQADYRRCLELDPKFALGYSNLADLSLKTRDYAGAVQFSQQALTIDPKLINGYTSRAMAYLFQKQIKEAMVDLEQALSIEPDNLEVRGLIFWLSAGTERPGLEAALQLENFITTNSSDNYALILKAIVSGIRDNWEAALNSLQEVSIQEDEELFIHFWLGLAYAYQFQNDKALEVLSYTIGVFVPFPLFNPLFWLKRDRPEFYQQQLLPLLTKHIS